MAATTSLTNGTTYNFKVRAMNTILEGAASNQISATPIAVIASAAITVVEPVTGAPAGATGYTCNVVTWSPAHTTFNSGTAYIAGTSITLTAVPDASYRLDGHRLHAYKRAGESADVLHAGE